MIADHTRTGRVALPISGGLDSRTTIAALKDVQTEVDAGRLWSYSYGYTEKSAETLIAGKVASAAGLPFTAFTIAHYLFDGLGEIIRASGGFSNATLEAMACGLPIVTADCGGMREAVTDGEDGFVVPVRDVHTMAASLEKLASDQALRSRIGQAARRKIPREFRSNEHLRQFYCSLSGRSSGAERRRGSSQVFRTRRERRFRVVFLNSIWQLYVRHRRNFHN